MKVRVKDIAAKAKVSPATVSNALNHKPGVSEKVTERILKIASEMGYEPPKEKNETIINISAWSFINRTGWLLWTRSFSPS